MTKAKKAAGAAAKAAAVAAIQEERKETLLLKAQKKLLQFVNAATSPKDLMVTPNDRIYIDEREAHGAHAEHHAHHYHEEDFFFDADLARKIFKERERRQPIHGFGTIKELVAIDKRILEVIKKRIFKFSSSAYGDWEELYPLNPMGVDFEIEHAALCRTYRVLFLADGTNTVLWDPSDEVTGQFEFLDGATTGLTTNLLCCGHSFLSDGQLLAAGGGGFGPNTPNSIQAWKFDPVPKTWTKTAGDMAKMRWYPTTMTLGDEIGATGSSGRVLVAGGWPNGTPYMEVYNEATDSFDTVTTAGPTHSFPQTYPSLSLLPGGQIFYIPTGFGNCSRNSVYSLNDPSSTFTFDAPQGSTNGTWVDDAGGPTNRTKGMAALIMQPTYPNVRAIVVGGGDSSTKATIRMVNLSGMTPVWDAPISFPDGRERINVNVVLLPDGTVHISGGLNTPPYTNYIFDPNAAVSPWTEVDVMNSPRHYHSCTLLLPSGKVMAAGGAASNGCTASVENTIEVFSPPYLFNPDGTPATRPDIIDVNGLIPSETVVPLIHHGQTFTIETTDASIISRVVLMRPMAVTHNTDTEQRLLQCTFTQTGPTTISAEAPDSAHPHSNAPRQYYLLFLLNNDLTPSEGIFMHLH